MKAAWLPEERFHTMVGVPTPTRPVPMPTLASPAEAAPSAARAALPPILWLCLAATWVVWGSTYLAIKYALVSFAPFLQMG